MQRSFLGCRAEYKAAWPILVVWIVLDNFATSYCFSHVLYADASQDALVGSVLGELELICRDLFA